MTLEQSLRDFAQSPYRSTPGGQAHAWEQIALLPPPQRREPPSALSNERCYVLIYKAKSITDSKSDWLSHAVSELEQIDSLAEADGLAPIDESMKAEAKRILEDLNPQSIDPVIYPEAGEIVIHFKAPTAPASVGIEVANDGRGACYSHLDGTNTSAHYGASQQIPDEFVRARLRSLSSLK